MSGRLRRILSILDRLESLLATAAYVVAAGILLADVVTRELLGFAIWGTDKIAVFGSIVAAFLGLALATASREHLRPKLADGWLPARWAPSIDRLSDALAALLCFALGAFAIAYVQGSIQNQERAAVLAVPLWPIQIVLPYAFFSSGIRHMIFALAPQLGPKTKPSE